MPNGHGGARTPANPSPVSGPGALSKRTDGQPVRDVTGLPYGEGADYRDIQSSAPMAKAAPANPMSLSAGGAAPIAMPTPLSAPTSMPDQPLTAGAPFGAGPGTEVLPSAPDQYKQIRKYMPTLLKLADLPTTSDATRQLIRYWRGAL